MSVSFSVSDLDRKLISIIVDRFMNAVAWEGEKIQLVMSVTACHANGCELDLQRMAEHEDLFSVVHDVSGIHNCIDRETGCLVGEFIPRFAVNQ